MSWPEIGVSILFEPDADHNTPPAPLEFEPCNKPLSEDEQLEMDALFNLLAWADKKASECHLYIIGQAS